MADLPFPRSSTPGRLPGEGEGRVINALAEKVGDTFLYRRAPGLTSVASTGGTGPRALLDVAGTLLAAMNGSVVRRTPANVVTTLSGALPGSDGVTMARNNRVTAGASTPDVVAVRESGGAYLIDPVALTVAPYPDADLPATVNSVDFLGGYFLFTVPDGRIFATQLNSTDQNALSFATAESRADGLVRGIVANGILYACGSETIEPWVNAGNTPFPLARATSVIPTGLLTTMAIAGFEQGWSLNPIFVAQDGTVHEIRGYETAPISTPDVERFIATSTVSTLEACVYTARGRGFWALSSDRGTWEYDVAIQSWHERISAGSDRWRASRSAKSGGAWIVGDRLSGALGRVDETVRTEFGQSVAWTVESGALKGFPARVAIPAMMANFTRADADVLVERSHDGGQTWTMPEARSLADCDKHPVRVNRMGLSTHHGLRVRLSTSSDAEFSFMGAAVPDPAERAP